MNGRLFDYALGSIRRGAWKNFSVFLVFSVLIFLLSSVTLITASIQKELRITLDELPEITVQRIVGGRQTAIPAERAYEIEQIAGVGKAYDRVWGYYYFQRAGVNFTVMGIDFFLPSYKESINLAIDSVDWDTIKSENFMIVGKGVKSVLERNGYFDYFNFIKSDGELARGDLAGTFKGETAMETNDVILLPMELAREVLDVDEDLATDVVVRIPNPEEIPTVAAKIRQRYPDCRVVTRQDMAVSYQNIFDYKSGLFLAFFVTSFFSFFIFTLDRLSNVVTGAMCAAGVTTTSRFGVYLLIVKLLGLYLFGFWIVADRIDTSREDYPFARFKFGYYVLIYLVLAAELVLELLYFGDIDPQKIVSCCGVLFSATATSVVGQVMQMPYGVLIPLFFGLFAIMAFLGRLGRSYLFSLTNLLFLAIAIIAVITLFSPYVYELPTHQCPFCLLQKEYHYMGYPLYASLFLGTFFGILEGFVHLFLKIKQHYFRLSLFFNTLFVIVASAYPIVYYLKNRVWL